MVSARSHRSSRILSARSSRSSANSCILRCSSPIGKHVLEQAVSQHRASMSWSKLSRSKQCETRSSTSSANSLCMSSSSVTVRSAPLACKPSAQMGALENKRMDLPRRSSVAHRASSASGRVSCSRTIPGSASVATSIGVLNVLGGPFVPNLFARVRAPILSLSHAFTSAWWSDWSTQASARRIC
jgi:hypothetical protein